MNNKTRVELEEYKKYKANYEFNQKEIEIIDGIEYVDKMPLLDEEGKTIRECEKWINVGYKNKGAYPKALSNLFPYEFEKQLNCLKEFLKG